MTLKKMDAPMGSRQNTVMPISDGSRNSTVVRRRFAVLGIYMVTPPPP